MASNAPPDLHEQQDIDPHNPTDNVVVVPEDCSLSDAMLILFIRPGGYGLMMWLATKLIVSRNIKVWMEDFGDIVQHDIELAQMISAFMALMVHMTSEDDDTDRYSAIQNAIQRRISLGMYTSLDPSKNQIRLLKIQPVPEMQPDATDETPNELVSCSMEIRSLNEEGLSFDALSYVWGDATQAMPIFVDGKLCLVTRNLFEALQSFRDNNVLSGLLWVDAICINQQDSQEINHQVALMARLYRQAEKVRIWIGQETKYIAVLFDKLEDCGGDQDRPNSSIMNAINLADIESGSIHGLLDLLSRKWWTRLWVVQEAGLARDPRLHCGSQEFAFRRLEDIFVTLTTMLSEEIGQSPAFRALSQSGLAQVQRLSFTLDMSRHGGNTNPTNLLDSTSHCESTVPHDRLYALLGLLPPTLEITPKYESRVEEVFESAAFRIMQWAGSLDLLRITALTQNRKLDLPSWVPEFGNTVDGLHLFKSAAHFKADLGALCSVSQDQPGRLTVQALIFDEVVASIDIVPLYNEISNPSTIEHIRDRLRACRNFVRTNISTHKVDELSFWQTMTTNILLTPDRGVRRWNEDKRDSGINSQWSNFIQDDSYNMEDNAKKLLMSSVWSAHSHSRLFLTRAGRLGLLDAATVDSGDVVAILAGSKEPAVLRPCPAQGPQAFKFVQNCYCHGVMDGEAVMEAYLNSLDKDDALAQKIEDAVAANRSSETRYRFQDSQSADFWVSLQDGISPMFKGTVLV